MEKTFIADRIKVACVGDSITCGGAIQEEEKRYPAQLQSLLEGEYLVQNFGVSGATLLKSGNKPYWTEPDFLTSHAFNPQIVVIKLGTNDSKPENWKHKDQFVQDYLNLIKSYHDLGSNPKVFICRPIPAFGFGNFGITDEVIKNEVIPLIDLVAQKAGVPVIDLYDALNWKGDLVPDRVHPNAEGARLIAEAVLEAINPK